MTFPLSPRLSAILDEKFAEQFAQIKSFSTLQNKINASQDIWNYESDNEEYLPYQMALYLNKKFVEGELYATLNHSGPLMKDHVDRANILTQLAELGVFTTDGQKSYEIPEGDNIYRQRSYLDFWIAVQYSKIPAIVSMFEKLYDDGFNVSATRFMRKYVKESIVLVAPKKGFEILDKKADIHTLHEYEKRIEFDLTLVSAVFSKTGTLVKGKSRCGITNGYDSFRCELSFDKPHVFACCLWNREWDLKQADEALLNRVLELF